MSVVGDAVIVDAAMTAAAVAVVAKALVLFRFVVGYCRRGSFSSVGMSWHTVLKCKQYVSVDK